MMGGGEKIKSYWQGEGVVEGITPPTGSFLTEGVEQHNRKTRTSLTRLERRRGTIPSGRNLDISPSFRLRLSRFASSRSNGYVLSRLATGWADVADIKMQDTDTPIEAVRHRHKTTRRWGVVAT